MSTEMMLMKLIFNYRRGQERPLLVDAVQNSVKNNKHAFIQTDRRMVCNIHENTGAQSLVVSDC